MPERLISDEFRREIGSKMITGVAICGSPFEMEMILDFTGLRGSGSSIYYSYVFQVPKWGYTVKKVDEWLEVTPEWAEYYSLTVGQKQKLMEQIKTGLTSAASAVTDYELAMHDVRRYREVLDYFKTKDQHVLRSLFVDRVDAYTGEGYSLVTMARRWPTIITDFIRMSEEWDDINTIRKELDVSQAEATVLKTKNNLFREWKKLFLPVVKERYARMENMAKSRKKSIDEYKSWMKPYLAKFKLMEERTEQKPSTNVSNPYITPGFGQSQAVTGVKLWMWKPYFSPEYRMAEAALREFEFKVGKGTKKLKFVINPYDDIVKEQKKKIEEHYGVTVTEEEVYNILKSATTPDVSGATQLDKYAMYYVLFEVNMILNLLKTPPPQGFETDNLMLMPVKAWWMSQNVILVHLIELYAREKAFEKYVREMVGAPELEKEIAEHVEEEFKEPAKPGKLTGPVKNFFRPASEFFKKPKVQKIGKGSRAIGGKFRRSLDRVLPAFVRRGPYETIFYERVSKMFARGIGGEYGTQINFLKKKMQIPG